MSVTLSPTALTAYLDCPLYFQHKYLDKWTTPDTAATVTGTFLHKSVASWYKDTKDPLWGDLDFLLFEVGGGEVDTAKAMWRQWVTHSLFRAPDGVEIEIDTDDRKLGHVHCFLDYVQVPVLIDHKFTGKMRAKDPLQLAFYRRFAPCTTKWGYEIITPDAYKVQWVSEEDMDEADNLIDDTADCIFNEMFAPTPRRFGKGTYYDWCPFQRECGDCKED